LDDPIFALDGDHLPITGVVLVPFFHSNLAIQHDTSLEVPDVSRLIFTILRRALYALLLLVPSLSPSSIQSLKSLASDLKFCT
jgi:hypothetical protein